MAQKKRRIKRETMNNRITLTNIDDAVDFWTGEMILAIGRGDIRGVIGRIILSHTKLGYDRGVQSMRRSK